jgi:hypothetical protein
MKKRLTGIRITAVLCAALGWWGLIYPQFALTPDTVKVIQADGDGSGRDVTGETALDGSLLRDMLNAGEGCIRFRSRLYADLKPLVEAFQNADQ